MLHRAVRAPMASPSGRFRAPTSSVRWLLLRSQGHPVRRGRQHFRPGTAAAVYPEHHRGGRQSPPRRTQLNGCGYVQGTWPPRPPCYSTLLGLRQKNGGRHLLATRSFSSKFSNRSLIFDVRSHVRCTPSYLELANKKISRLQMTKIPLFARSMVYVCMRCYIKVFLAIYG